jgi:hypothetical protein
VTLKGEKSLARMDETEFHEHKHDGFLVFLCFFGGSLVGYFVMHHFALFGI